VTKYVIFYEDHMGYSPIIVRGPTLEEPCIIFFAPQPFMFMKNN
jgi:hypothetical protein